MEASLRRRALLLINRNSRNGASDIDAALARLQELDVALIQPDLERPAQIPTLIRRHREEVDLVIVGGGDGSLNAAAPALVEAGLPLGVLPLGTANDLARTLDIPTDPVQACEVIAGGMRHRIDLGRVNGHYFFNVAHIGLGVQVARTISGQAKQRLGSWAYLTALGSALKAMRAFRAHVECDGRSRRIWTSQIAVGNGRHFGGGVTVAEEAEIDDGCFFLCSVAPLGWRELLRILLRARAMHAGRFDRNDPVRVERGRHIEIRTARHMTISADGEIVGRTPAQFELVRGALEVIVPHSYLQTEVRHAAQG